MIRRPLARIAIVALVAVGGSAMPVSGAEPGSRDICSLRVTVGGLKSNDGRVRVAVFGGPDTWLKKATVAKILEIQNREAEWVVPDLACGEYAIAVFHDTNANGKNDRNVFGIPREPYGFSNRARRAFGAPDWDAAKFTVSPQAITARIDVK